MADEAGQSTFDRVEIAIAILLGVAAMLTAWAAFQNSQLGSTVTAAYSAGIKYADAASQKHNDATAIEVADETVFLEYAKAQQAGDTELATYIHKDLMSPELAAAIDWWVAQPETARAATPFTHDNPNWDDTAFQEAKALGAQAEAQDAAAKRADDLGGRFEILSIFIAIALFLFGVASLVRQERIKIGLAVVGGVILAYSIIRLIELGNPAGVSVGMLF